MKLFNFDLAAINPFKGKAIEPEVLKDKPATEVIRQKPAEAWALQESERAIKRMIKEIGFEGGIGADIMREIFRVEIKIKEWRDALELHESIINPDREPLQTMYFDVADDSQVISKAGKITAELRSLDFQVFEGDTENTEKTKLLKQRWFRDLIKIHYETNLYGFSLVGMDVTSNPKNIYVPVVFDRRFVYPDFKDGVIMDHTRSKTIPISALEGLTLTFGEKRSLGRFNAVMPYYLFKKQGFTSWATFLRKMGVPIPFIGTDLTNTDNVSKLKEGLTNLGNKSWFLVPKGDEIKFEGGSTSQSGADLFDKLTEKADAAISKILEGQTMTTDDGSSRSQAEVHQNTAKSFFISFKDEMLIDFNDQLIIKLTADGFFNGREEIRVIESTDTAKLIEWVEKLSKAGFNIDPEWLEEKTGIKLDEVQTVQTAGAIVASYAKDLGLSEEETEVILDKLNSK